MIDKQKRLHEYEYLRMYCGVHTQIDLAKALHYSRNAITLALNGNEKYLTENLFRMSALRILAYSIWIIC